VRIRHTEISLAPDGGIAHLTMTVHTPNAPTPRLRSRVVTANFTRDSVRIAIQDSAGTRDTAFAIGGELTFPHVSMMYSVIEPEVAQAMLRGAAAHLAAGDSVPFHQWYPDRDIGETFVLHDGWVHPVANGRVELWHDWLSGIGDLTVDSAGRMLTYSGMRSTY